MNRIKVKKWLIFLFLTSLFLNYQLLAQTIISGKVSDNAQNKALSNAIITVNKLNTEITVGYTMSKPSGQFELKTKVVSDSLTLSIKMLGYAAQRINVANRSQTINFDLEQSSIELKEVKVRPVPVQKYGDTLSYAVSAFKDKNDRDCRYYQKTARC